MVDNVEGLTSEMLRRVHSKLDDIQSEMRLRFTGVETGLGAIEHHLAAFHAVDVARADDIADLRRRIERVERRLDFPLRCERCAGFGWGIGVEDRTSL